VITDLGVFDVVEGGFKVVELADGVTVDEVHAKTEGTLVA
jgi:3-oxoacid CoA-transferase subunit B